MADTPKPGESNSDASGSDPSSSVHPAEPTTSEDAPSAEPEAAPSGDGDAVTAEDSAASADATQPPPGGSAPTAQAAPEPESESDDDDTPTVVSKAPPEASLDGTPTLVPTDAPATPEPEAPPKKGPEVDEHAKTRIFEPSEVAAMMSEAGLRKDADAKDSEGDEGDESGEEPLAQSFDELDLPDAVRTAVANMGWDSPTPVQAKTFPLVAAGKDILVQSQTGSGKTGAFCLPWLAQRFEAGDATQTGVQMLVLTPTRELAKQVCDQLQQMAQDTDVRTLPIYGGTAMQPQLQALRDGIHAVVGTPGRILDHIRRRSLKLDRVRMAVLDEADEMLSMGFLEDIHAILDACSTERQTCLFSATVPPDIERIARRYMHDPESVMLSGDQVAAAEINHVYYQVSGTIKVRALLDMIAIEEPANGLVFCNTREETYVVASALHREGFQAEPLSSDLTQAARERVMGRMRGGQLRFLVATDVASRGIDISHIGHVINYSFPENAESYVHRTGRTGRAGRPGVAISLISPQELGNHYYLKLQYPSIEFEERSLPSPEELGKQRIQNKLDQVSRLFPELVSPEWTLLTRNLMTDPRGEQVLAFLLKEAMTRVAQERDQGDGIETRRPRGDGDRRGRGRGRRDDFGDRDRERPERGRGRWEDEPEGEPQARDRRDGEDGAEGDDRRRRRSGRDRGRRDEQHRDRPERDRRDDRGDRGDREQRGDRAPREGRGDRDRDGRRGRGRGRDRDRDRDRDRRDGDRGRDRGDRRDEQSEQEPERRRRRRRNRESEPAQTDEAQTSEGTTDAPPVEAEVAPAEPAPAEPAAPEAPADAESVAPDAPEETPAAAPDAKATDDAPSTDDASSEQAPSTEGDAEGESSAAAEGEDGGGRRRRRRRRRRRGGRDESEGGEGEAKSEAQPEPESQGDTGAPSPATAIATDDLGATTQSTVDPDESVEATDDVEMVEAEGGSDEITDPGTMTGLTARRRRRRRRRRGRGRDEENTSETPEGEASEAQPATDARPARDGRNDESKNDEEAGDGKRRRRRRRGGRRRGRGGDGAADENAPSVPNPVVHVSQDQIVIDIDETELEVVRDEFGEIDELDDLTLKGRRRGVMETLQDEVELEDLSAADRTTADSDDGDSDAESDEDETDDGSEESSEAEASSDETGDAEAAPSTDEEDPKEVKKRKRRRRRRRKKAPAPPPELTAPPHKDFWEVWANRFTYQDFEDSTYLGGTAAVPDEPDEPERPPRRSSSPPPEMPAVEDEEDFVRVRLNVGRKHGKKAAHIRELLAESFGLARKAVRDLTVGEASSRFRLGAKALVRLEELIVDFTFDGIDLTVTRIEPKPKPSEAAAPEAKADEPKAKSDEPEAKSDEPAEAKADEPEAKSDESAEAKADEPEAKADESAEAKADEPKAKADEPEAKADEPEAKTDEPEAKADEPEAKADEPEAKADEPEAKADEPAGADPAEPTS